MQLLTHHYSAPPFPYLDPPNASQLRQLHLDSNLCLPRIVHLRIDEAPHAPIIAVGGVQLCHLGIGQAFRCGALPSNLCHDADDDLFARLRVHWMCIVE